MKRVSFSFKPRCLQLEDRCQPGMMLTSGIGTSLLAGTFGGALDFQDLAQQARPLSGVVAEKSSAYTNGITVQPTIVPPPAIGLQDPLAQPPITPLSQPTVMPDQQIHLVEVGNANHHGKTGGLAPVGSGCGEAVVNGNFATGDLTGWTVAEPNDPNVFVGPGPFSSTDLFLGTLGAVNVIQQEVPTPVCFNYTISLDVNSEGGSPNQLLVLWNNNIVANLLNDSGGTFHFSAAINTAESNSTLTIVERQDPAFFEVTHVSAFA